MIIPHLRIVEESRWRRLEDSLCLQRERHVSVNSHAKMYKRVFLQRESNQRLKQVEAWALPTIRTTTSLSLSLSYYIYLAVIIKIFKLQFSGCRFNKPGCIYSIHQAADRMDAGSETTDRNFAGSSRIFSFLNFSKNLQKYASPTYNLFIELRNIFLLMKNLKSILTKSHIIFKYWKISVQGTSMQ